MKLHSLLHTLRSFIPPMHLRSARQSPTFVFSCLALVILGPLLLPGHIFALDSTLAVNQNISGYFWNTSDGAKSVLAGHYNSAPIAMLFNLFDIFLPFWLVEKVWLFLILTLAGVGAYKLPNLLGIGRFYAGVFYMLNPFAYTRFITGQWGLLGAYAIAPFALTSFINLLEYPSRRNAAKTAFLVTVIGFMQIHGLGLIFLLFTFIYISHCFKNRRSFRTTAPFFCLTTIIFIGINLFWIVRYTASTASSIDMMNSSDLTFFAVSSPLDALSLRGFWLSSTFIDLSDVLPIWWVVFVPIFFLAAEGSQRMILQKDLRWLGIGLTALAIMSVFLAIGPSLSITKPIFVWLWDAVPQYRSFRDSHKFLALLALGYAYLGGYSLQWVGISLQRATRAIKRLTYCGITLLFIGVILYGAPIFWSWGQIKSTEFPQDWHTAHSLLLEDTERYNVLVLPWHMYMGVTWLPNRSKNIASPIHVFFTQSLIAGDNLELPETPSQSSNPVSKYVEAILDTNESLQHFGKALVPLNARYVLLTKTGDHANYTFLYDVPDLDLVFEGPNIALFKNRWPTADAYLVEHKASVANFDEYIDHLPAENPNSKVYQFELGAFAGIPKDTGASKSLSPVTLTKKSPVSYQIDSPGAGYVVLTLPQHERNDWHYEGEYEFMNLGMFPVFYVSEGVSTLEVGDFWTFDVPLYMLSLFTTIVTIWLYYHGRRRNFEILN